jgi:hypothetical protein
VTGFLIHGECEKCFKVNDLAVVKFLMRQGKSPLGTPLYRTIFSVCSVCDKSLGIKRIPSHKRIVDVSHGYCRDCYLDVAHKNKILTQNQRWEYFKLSLRRYLSSWVAVLKSFFHEAA